MRSSTVLRSLLAGIVVAVSACGSGSSGDAATATAAPGSEAPVTDPVGTTAADMTAATTVAPSTTALAPTTQAPVTEPARAIGIVGTVIDIDYYGACGNETLDLDGVTWYPLLPEEQDEIDVIDYAAAEVITEPSGLRRSPSPEPGDDVGTLFVYEDGLGRFRSDSGLIDLWMTTEEQTYQFEC